MENFPLAVADHASNERKAAATCMNLVVQYPDRLSLVTTAARIAQEEIQHFQMVFDRMKKAGFPLQPDEKDLYARKLIQSVRAKGEERLMDRLIINSLIEMRGVERFYLLAQYHPEKDWREFYADLSASEIGHGFAFLKEAKKIFSKETVGKRYQELLEAEAEACSKTEITWRFH